MFRHTIEQQHLYTEGEGELNNDQWLRVRPYIQKIVDDKQFDDEYLGNWVRTWLELQP